MPRTITLSEAVAILKTASAVVVDDDAVTYAALSDLDGSDDNEFLQLAWTDSEGCDYSITCCEEGNSVISVSGASLFFVDEEGEQVQVTPLFTKEL